jgi:hypothetical protein
MFFSRIFSLPFWWYGQGLELFVGHLKNAISNFSEVLAVRVWAKNLFIPMYGDSSVLGRAISFGIRFVMLIVRSLGVAIYIFGTMIVFIVYILILPISIVGLFYHLFSFL